MLTKKMHKALNDQINAELYSAYLYLAMSAYYEDKNLTGFAHWMKMQAQEEVEHGMQFYNFIAGRGGRVILEAVKKPPKEWPSPLVPFQKSYEHEKSVTKIIYALVDMAITEKDHATHVFLQKFVTEQVEEEASVDRVVQQLKLAGDGPSTLFIIDRELGNRTQAAQ